MNHTCTCNIKVHCKSVRSGYTSSGGSSGLLPPKASDTKIFLSKRNYRWGGSTLKFNTIKIKLRENDHISMRW